MDSLHKHSNFYKHNIIVWSDESLQQWESTPIYRLKMKIDSEIGSSSEGDVSHFGRGGRVSILLFLSAHRFISSMETFGTTQYLWV